MVSICQSEFFRHFSYKMWYGRSRQVVVEKSEIVKTLTIALYVSYDAELNGMHLWVRIFPSFFIQNVVGQKKIISRHLFHKLWNFMVASEMIHMKRGK